MGTSSINRGIFVPARGLFTQLLLHQEVHICLTIFLCSVSCACLVDIANVFSYLLLSSCGLSPDMTVA